MPRPHRDALRSVLLVAALLAGLVGVRWSVTGALDRPMAPPASARPAHDDPDDQTVVFRQGGYTVLVADQRAWAVRAGRAAPRRPLGPAVAALPPLSEPGEFAQLEVPQLVHLGGAWRILFSAWPRDHSAARLARPGVVAEGGTHYLTSSETFGRYTLDRDAFLVGDPQSRYYAGRLIRRDGGWFFIAWRHDGGDGRFLGELSDPMPLTVHADGSLSVQLIPTD